ncbi:DNA-binding response regulator [Geobacter grbiciae]|nr:DNA-binding response regulator [Geobacter grbiciae]
MERETILIIDEAGFSRVCSAILEAEGYRAETIPHESLESRTVCNDGVGLVIASYPYGSRFFEDLCRFSLPIIVLTDHISKDLLSVLEGFENSICMIKPLDYKKFTSVVRQMMAGTYASQGGYSIV